MTRERRTVAPRHRKYYYLLLCAVVSSVVVIFRCHSSRDIKAQESLAIDLPHNPARESSLNSPISHSRERRSDGLPSAKGAKQDKAIRARGEKIERKRKRQAKDSHRPLPTDGKGDAEETILDVAIAQKQVEITTPEEVVARKETDAVSQNRDMRADASRAGGGPWTFPPPPSKWLGDVSSSLFCGIAKCAFRSKMSQARNGSDPDQTQYGYLVSQARREVAYRPATPSFEKQRRSAERARELSEKYVIKHFLLGELLKFNITDEQIAEMNLNNNTIMDGHIGRWTVDLDLEYRTEKEDPHILVQPIQLAPKSSMVFGCHKDRIRDVTEKLRGANLKHLTALELKAFEAQVRCDLNATQRMLSSAEGDCLWKDFQIFFNPDTGSIHHLDFDRCYTKIKKVDSAKCMTRLVEFLNLAYRRRGGQKALFGTTLLASNGTTSSKGKEKKKQMTAQKA